MRNREMEGLSLPQAANIAATAAIMIILFVFIFFIYFSRLRRNP
jgi:hypothetical protein